MIKTKKIHAGAYEYSNGKFTVEVIRVPPNPAYGDKDDMWIAAALWDRNIYTDPLPKKWMAVEDAKNWLK
jgi:hypothetical protein